jgi:hypothetical protein
MAVHVSWKASLGGPGHRAERSGQEGTATAPEWGTVARTAEGQMMTELAG